MKVRRASELQRNLFSSLWKQAQGYKNISSAGNTINCISILPLINPRRACAARVTVVVLCVCPSVRPSVCLFVHDYSRTTGYEAAYERYQHLQCHKGTKNKLAILLKRLRSRDIVKTSEKANMPSPSINGGHAYNN